MALEFSELYGDPYQDVTFEMSGDRLVRVIAAIVAAAMRDDPARGRRIAAAWLSAADLAYRDARDIEHMNVLIGFRNEVVASSTPLHLSSHWMPNALERRKSVRRTVHVPGTVASLGIVSPCTIVNISDGGAKIRVPADLQLQYEVVLRVPEFGVALKASIVWRRETEMGVQF